MRGTGLLRDGLGWVAQEAGLVLFRGPCLAFWAAGYLCRCSKAGSSVTGPSKPENKDPQLSGPLGRAASLCCGL